MIETNKMKIFTLLVLVCTSRAYQTESPEELGNDEVVGSDDIKAMAASMNEYGPNWESLDAHPLPEWYHSAKVGIMIHWGVYSVPAFQSEWFWFLWKTGKRNIVDFMAQNYPPGFSYQGFAPKFTAKFFDPNEWADMFRRAGAKFRGARQKFHTYVVLTTKHHDGYGLFPSKHSFSWNSVDVGPHRDLTDEIATAVREFGMQFGVYHSLMEWFNPLYNEDEKNFFSTNKFVTEKLMPDLEQIVLQYKPSVIWLDGEWDAPSSYWQSEQFLAWLYSVSPIKHDVVVNDRMGAGCRGVHGDFYNNEITNTQETMKRTKQNKKYELSVSLDKMSWGYRRNMRLNELVTIDELLQYLIVTVSCGGNFLVNIGPTKEGTIPLIFQETLQALGNFLYVNGEAIYSTSCWRYQNDTLNWNVWYTCRTEEKYDASRALDVAHPNKITAIYALFQRWPRNNVLKLKAIAAEMYSGRYQILLLGQNASLKWKISNDGIVNILLPDRATVVFNNAWALKLTTVANNATTKGTATS